MFAIRRCPVRWLPDAKVGLLDVVVGEADVARKSCDAIPPRTLRSCPWSEMKLCDNPTELLASRETKLLIDWLKSSYDYIIIDMAPLISTVDVLAVSRLGRILTCS